MCQRSVVKHPLCLCTRSNDIHSLYSILLCCVVHNRMCENECLHRIIAEFSGKCIRSDLSHGHKTQRVQTARPSHEVMSSSGYWALPSQLHPWYKPPTLKRKPSGMLPRSESPFPVDEYDYDSRVKRQRRITLDQTCSKKRNLPSPPQSPIESNDQHLHLPKRQRCTTLERGLEGLSLTPPTPSALQASGYSSCLPAPVSAVLAHPPDLSSRLSEMSLAMPCSRPIPSPSTSPSTSMPFTSASTCVPPTPALTADVYAPSDVKMRTSSWYEPEKDRACISFQARVAVGVGGST